MPVSIGPRIGVQGADEFRQAFRLMAQDAKKFKTELDEVKASFTANDTAMDRSKAVTEQLTKQLEQNTRVLQVATDTREKAKEAVDNAAEAYEAEKAKLKEIPELVKKNADAVAALTDKYERQKKWTEEVKDSQNKAKKSYEDITQKVDTQKTRIAYLKEEYDKHNAAVKKMREEQGRNSEEVKKASAALKDEREQIKEAKKDLANLKEEQKEARSNLTLANKLVKENTSELKENEKELQKAIKANKDENTLIEEQEKKIHNASTRLYEAQNVLSQYDEKVSEVTIDQKELNKQLEETPGRLEIFANHMSGLGELLSNVGTSLSTYVTAPLVALGTYGVKNASNLTDGMAKIYTIATETQEPMESMRQGLIDLSDATGFALDDLTEAAYQAVSASVDAGDAVEFMGDATKLARAGFTTTEKSVDLLTTIMNSYGKETYTAAYLSDLLLRTQNDGKTIVDQLASSMGVVIPTAAAYNVGIEQIAAAYATMTKQGVNTARATTMLNALFTELEKPDKDAAALLLDLTGKSFAQLMDDGMSLGEVLSILYNNLDRNSEAFANLFKNIRSGRAANALMADDASILNYELERMQDVTGQTDYALEMLETPSLKARRALNKLKNSTIDLGDTLITELYPVFEKLVGVVDDFRNWVKNLSDEQKKSIARTAGMVAAIGPLLKVLGTVFTVGGKTIDLFIKIKAATKGAATGMKAFGAIAEADGLGLAALSPILTAAVGGYLALGAAAALSAANYRDQILASSGLTKEQQELVTSSRALNDAYTDLDTKAREQNTAIDSNATMAQALVDKYNNLVEVTGLVTDKDKALADTYLNQLAEALGMEIEDVQALVDEHGKLSASIDEVIQKKRAEATLNAYQSKYEEALVKVGEAEKNVADLSSTLEQRKKELANATSNQQYWEKRYYDELNSVNGLTDDTKRKYEEATIAMNNSTLAVEGVESELARAEETYFGFNSTIEHYEGLQADIMVGSAYEIEASLMKLRDGFIKAEYGTEESLKKQVKNAKTNLDKIQKAFDEGAEGITQEMLDAYRKLYSDSEQELSKWRELNGYTTEETMDEIAQIIEDNKGDITNATKDAMSGVSSEVEASARKAANTADTGFESIVEAMRKKINPARMTSKELAEAIVSEFKDHKYFDQMFSAGSYFMQGFINGLKAVNVSKTSNKIMTDTIQASKQTLGEKSPSKVMEQVGEYFTQGFAIGISNENNLAKQSARNMAQSAVDSSWMTSNWTPTGIGYATQGMSSNTRNITAPINVSVNVSGNVDDVDALADVIAERINDQIIRKNEVFA